jgi:hypothetical protein
MITASLIYIGVTFLLALVDAIRIKVKWGKVPNIDHKLSSELALILSGPVASVCILNTEPFGWTWLLRFDIIFAGLIAVRFAFYDLFINFLRILTKTNPTMRLDYVSTKTSSYEDQHSEKISFWQKRAIGVAGWVVIMFVYYKIF